MSEQPYYAPNRQPDAPRTKRQTEHLWAIRLDGRQYDGELLDHGTWGVEFQVLYDWSGSTGAAGRCENWRSPKRSSGKRSTCATAAS